jgi:Fur family ferric uptake transcriptional regulator
VAAEDVLRAAGHRVSASRRVALQGLFAAVGPVSAEYLAGGLDGRTATCDVPSAYRNLELFERLGLVRHVHIGHGPGLYALVSGDERAYAVCESCGQLTRLETGDVTAIRDRIAGRSGFQAHFSHFPILGLCRECAAGRGGERSREHSHGDHVHSHDV